MKFPSMAIWSSGKRQNIPCCNANGTLDMALSRWWYSGAVMETWARQPWQRGVENSIFPNWKSAAVSKNEPEVWKDFEQFWNVNANVFVVKAGLCFSFGSIIHELVEWVSGMGADVVKPQMAFWKPMFKTLGNATKKSVGFIRGASTDVAEGLIAARKWIAAKHSWRRAVLGEPPDARPDERFALCHLGTNASGMGIASPLGIVKDRVGTPANWFYHSGAVVKKFFSEYQHGPGVRRTKFISM